MEGKTTMGPRAARFRGAAALAGASLALLLAVAPATAVVVGHEPYSGEDGFSYDDCGFWVDVAVEFEGVLHFRVGTGKDESAFFVHNRFSYREVHTARDSGAWIVVSGDGLFQETRATRIEGTIFEFNAVLAGQPFRVTDANGNLLVRDRGVIRQAILFDTLGDDVPGGHFIDEIGFEVSGPHAGLEADLCAFLD